MNHEIATRWVAALRDPNARQGHEALYDGEGHCCLGKLCETMGEKFERIYAGSDHCFAIRRDHENGFDLIQDFLPIDIASNAEMFSVHGTPRQGKIEINGKVFDSLWQANDAGVSFADIADWIEANYERL